MYVITGATGNTGSVAARELLARGQKVRVIGRSADRLKSLADEGAEPFICDLAHGAKLTEAFRDAGAVYAMIPLDLAIDTYRANQDCVSDALCFKTGWRPREA